MRNKVDKKKSRMAPVGIDSMTFGGRGLGRLDGKAVFVEGAVPGDELVAEIFNEKDKWAEAKISSMTRKSDLRKPSACSYSEECGGCQWDEITVEQQLIWKQQFVRDAFQKQAKISLPDSFEVIKSEASTHYRNRALLRGTIHDDGQVSAGFFKKSSRIQIQVRNCLIVDQALNEVIEKVNSLVVSDQPGKFRLELQFFPALSENQKASVCALVHPVTKKGEKEPDELIKALQQMPEIVWAGSAFDQKALPVIPLEKNSQGLTWFTSPGLFFQVNLGQNQQLRTLIKAAFDKLGPVSHVLDLFCGSGNIALSLADGVRNVTGVESHPGSIRVARHAAKFNQIETIKFHIQDSHKFLKKSVEAQKTWDLVIADPPRAGMKSCIPYLLSMKPKHLFYVSCDPVTLARDISQLMSAYELTELKALDFFPHTYHVESFAVLTLKGS